MLRDQRFKCRHNSEVGIPRLMPLAALAALLPLRVLRLGLLEDGDVRIGVFPEREEILIGGAGFGSGVRLWVRPLWVTLGRH